jgi:hypothetical protein
MAYNPSLASCELVRTPGINLSSLVPQLDSTATEIVTNQRDALVERKELAQKTKDFRKLDDDAKLSEFKSLLKGKEMTAMQRNEC